jgi:AraC family transcriptional regulator
MDALERLNQALAYIEEHLIDEIEFEQIERLALCSEYHFRRMFSYLAGISLSEYIRRRRLTLAAFELVRPV